MVRVCGAGSAQEVGRASMWMGCKRGGILSVGMEPEVIIKRVWVSYKGGSSQGQGEAQVRRKEDSKNASELWVHLLL